MISNYSTSYNAVNVGIVIPVLNYSIIQSSKSSSSNGDEPYLTPEIHDAEEVEGDGASSSSVPSILRGLLTTIDNNNSEEQGSNDEQESLVASSLLGGMIL